MSHNAKAEMLQQTATKRTRASKPKVTTGCLTCRTRRVKCDENHPSCRRCSNTGRMCEWKFSLPTNHISRLSRIASAIAKQPGQLAGSEEERRCFQFFRAKTVVQLSGFFGESFWDQYVSKVCMNEEAVWHAAVALGSLHQNGGRQSLDVFGLRQYIKAIGLLRDVVSRQEDMPTDVALTCCVLFVCFESLRGHLASAIIHIESGLKLLSELQQRNINGGDAGSDTAVLYDSTPDQHLQSICTILTRFDIQATQLICQRCPHLQPPRALTSGLHCPSVPSIFTSIGQALVSCNQLWYFCLCSLQQPHSEPDSYGKTRAVCLQLCCQKLAQWSKAFSRFMAHSGAKLDLVGRQAANILRLNHIIADLSLGHDYQSNMDDESVWNGHFTEFAEILSIATEVIDSSKETGEEVMFSTDTNVLGHLYFVAIRCRYGILRRKAIDLMRLSPRVEGLWDSRLLVKIAEKVMNIEETQEGGVACASVSDVALTFDGDARIVSLKYLRAGSSNDWLEREDRLVW